MLLDTLTAVWTLDLVSGGTRVVAGVLLAGSSVRVTSKLWGEWGPRRWQERMDLAGVFTMEQTKEVWRGGNSGEDRRQERLQASGLRNSHLLPWEEGEERFRGENSTATTVPI